MIIISTCTFKAAENSSLKINTLNYFPLLEGLSFDVLITSDENCIKLDKFNKCCSTEEHIGYHLLFEKKYVFEELRTTTKKMQWSKWPWQSHQLIHSQERDKLITVYKKHFTVCSKIIFSAYPNSINTS